MTYFPLWKLKEVILNNLFSWFALKSCTYVFFCPTLGNIWQTYFDTMSKVLLKTIDTSLHVAIFGTPQEYHRFSSVQLEVLVFTSL